MIRISTLDYSIFLSVKAEEEGNLGWISLHANVSQNGRANAGLGGFSAVCSTS